MKGSATVALETPPKSDRGFLALAAELLKARLTTMVLLTTAAGFFLGNEGEARWGLFLHTLVGTGCLAGAAAMLNEWLEREYDARMVRTAERPLPAGLVKPEPVLLWGGVAGGFGLVYLAMLAGMLTAILGAVTLVSYLLFYTPLKRVTSFNTLVGAIPGALPPVIGWSASRGSLGVEGWSLFALLALWQIPHFLAIAWLYRQDYARAGFTMLPGRDPTGRLTSSLALAVSMGLLAVSVVPYRLGLVQGWATVGVVLVGGMFVWRAFVFWREVTDANARLLFVISIIYLPSVLGLMLAGKN